MELNLIFEYKGQGFGSRTAFVNNQESLKNIDGINISVNSVRKKDICHTHTIGPLSFFHLIRNRPLIYSYHILPKENEFLRLPPTAIFSFVSMFVKRASVIIATSPFCKKVAIENGATRPVAVISPGISAGISPNKEKRQIFRERHGITDEMVFYCIAPPIEKKGLSYFLEAAQRFRGQAKFVWVGRLFPHLKVKYTLEQLRERYPEVIFTGFVHDISTAHNAGDVLLFPSHYEGMGVPILEAGTCRNPAIIRDIDSFSWLSHGKDCAKFSTKDGMLRIISEILEKKPMLNKLRKGSGRMADRHRLDVVGSAYASLYKLCCDGSYAEAGKINTYITC